jgi:hypothetical protein
MESLPDEINLLIVSFIDEAEWRVTKYSSYRLVTRQFARIGAQHMFESFQFRPTEAAIERMNSIATSDLSRYVKVLDFDGELEAADGTLVAVSEDVRIQLFTKVVWGFSQVKSPIAFLNAQHLPRNIFQSDAMPNQLTNITTLDLMIDAATELPDDDEVYVKVSALKTFLARLHKLERLNLRFGQDNDWSEWNMPPAVKEVMPSGHTWAYLRSIQLECVSVMADDIIQLLAKYEGTLECFHFRQLHLSDVDSPVEWDNEDAAEQDGPKRELAWRSIFEQISKMESLQHGEVRRRSAKPLKLIKTDVMEWLMEDWVEVETDSNAEDLDTEQSDVEHANEEDEDEEDEDEEDEDEEDDIGR